jgi:hypothetical protein
VLHGIEQKSSRQSRAVTLRPTPGQKRPVRAALAFSAEVARLWVGYLRGG